MRFLQTVCEKRLLLWSCPGVSLHRSERRSPDKFSWDIFGNFTHLSRHIPTLVRIGQKVTDTLHQYLRTFIIFGCYWTSRPRKFSSSATPLWKSHSSPFTRFLKLGTGISEPVITVILLWPALQCVDLCKQTTADKHKVSNHPQEPYEAFQIVQKGTNFTDTSKVKRVGVTVALYVSMQQVSPLGYLLLSVTDTTKMVAVGSCETLLLTYQTTCYHDTESRNINPKSGICYRHWDL
jgi:hypothetical protein